MNKEKLESLKTDSTFLSLYNEGMSALYRSGIFDMLRDNGRISAVDPRVPNYVEYQASIANWSVGYNQALDHLLMFKELFLADETKPSLPMDFGATDEALAKGDLTQEEYNAIRSNSPIPQLKPESGRAGTTATDRNSAKG